MHCKFIINFELHQVNLHEINAFWDVLFLDGMDRPLMDKGFCVLKIVLLNLVQEYVLPRFYDGSEILQSAMLVMGFILYNFFLPNFPFSEIGYSLFFGRVILNKRKESLL